MNPWLDLFYRLVGVWFLRDVAADQLTTPLAYRDETLDIAVYQSTKLTNRRGRDPEKTVARYVHEALKQRAIGNRVRFDFDTVGFPAHFEEPNPPRKALDWWGQREVAAADANLLLLHIGGGGISYLGGTHGLGPAYHINRDLAFREEAPSGKHPAYRNTRTCLHEIGHMFNGRHSDNMLRPPSMTYSDDAIEAFREYSTAGRSTFLATVR